MQAYACLGQLYTPCVKDDSRAVRFGWYLVLGNPSSSLFRFSPLLPPSYLYIRPVSRAPTPHGRGGRHPLSSLLVVQ